MQPFQQRVVDEKSELDKKLGALGDFFTGDVYPVLDAKSQSLLQRQYILMQLYSETLELRIEGF